LRKHVVIELSPHRVAVAVLRGNAVVDCRVEQLEHTDWDARWPVVLAALEPRLSAIVAELGAAGGTATVLYSAPTALAAVFACPASAGAAGAERAALLALAEQTHLALPLNPHEAHCLGADPWGDARSGPQRHTLAVLDQDSSTLALAALVRQVGLEPVIILPADAVPMAAVVRSVLGRRADQPIAVLWFGEHTSILAAGSRGRVRFTRVLRLGTQTLVDALRRPIRIPVAPGTSSAAAETLTLDYGAAAKLLAAIGIPDPQQVIAEAGGVTGAAILPLLQPVLQRIALEIKQSLRFGMAEEERAHVQLAVEGAGGALPRLGEALSNLCGSPLAPPEQCPGIGIVVGDPAGEAGGLVAAWGELSRVGVNLLPEEIENAQSRRRLRTRVWAGIGAALALVALYAGSTRIALASAQDQLAKAKARSDQVQQSQTTQNAARAADALKRVLQGRIATELGPSTDWATVLSVLAEQTPASIKLMSVDMQVTEAGPTAHIDGYVRAADSGDFARLLREFSESLESMPIVTGVRVGATQRVQVRGSDVQRFELTLSLLPCAPPVNLEPRQTGAIIESVSTGGGS
jgi:hypothetical protein